MRAQGLLASPLLPFPSPLSLLPLSPFYVARVWFFIVFQYCIFFCMALFAYIVEDVPDDVVIQLQRREFIVTKLVDCLEDEEEDFDVRSADSSMKVR